MIMNLQLFAGGHSVTVNKDAHMTTASASSTSDVQAEATVTLTLTPASNYEVANVEVLAGGVTIHQDGTTVSFTMGSENVIINVTSQKNNLYKVVENCDVTINGTKTSLVKNVTPIYTACGGLADVECTETAITLDAAVVAEMVKAGIIVKKPAWKGEPTPSE